MMNGPQDRYYLTARDDGTDPYSNTPEMDVTALAAALSELRNAWREDNGVFSVRVMCAVGAVITQTEAICDFEDGKGQA